MKSSAPARAQSSPLIDGDAVIPLCLITDPRLTPGDVRCAAFLFAWSAVTRGEGDPPSRRQIATALGASMTQATRWLVRLHDTGWITREERSAAAWGLTVHREPVSR